MKINLKKNTTNSLKGLPWWLKCQRICLQCRRPGFYPWIGRIIWRKEWLLTPVFLPGEFHGQGSLAWHSPWGCKESDMTERLSLSPLNGVFLTLTHLGLRYWTKRMWWLTIMFNRVSGKFQEGNFVSLYLHNI